MSLLATRSGGVLGVFFRLVVLLAVLVVAGCESIPVDGVTPTLQDDSPLALEVAAAIRQRPELAGVRISVKTLREGTVRLSGSVDNTNQRSNAEQAALAVPGVISVVNTLFLN